MTSPQTLVALDNVTVGYDHHPAIHHLRLQIQAGDMLAVVGPNGAGKSTFLKLLTGERLSIDGQVQLPDRRSCRVAYLPQINQTDRQFPITVRDLVASGLWHRCGAFGRVRREDLHRIDEALEQVGMLGYGHRVISALSGGEFQRVRFAQLMLQDARMVVLDEPFVGIDMTTTEALSKLLAHWHAQGTTIVAALHEQDIVHRWFPRTLLIAREMIACGPTAEVLTPANWQRALDRSVRARHDSQRWCEGPETVDMGESLPSDTQRGADSHAQHAHSHDHPHAHDPVHVRMHTHAHAAGAPSTPAKAGQGAEHRV